MCTNAHLEDVDPLVELDGKERAQVGLVCRR